MSILDDLTGGLFSKHHRYGYYDGGDDDWDDDEYLDDDYDDDQNKEFYQIAFQFDDQEPIVWIDDIDIRDSIHFEIFYSEDPKEQENTFMQFKCKTTGKIFKLYARKK